MIRLAFGLVAGAALALSEAPSTAVSVRTFRFRPDTVTVIAGDSVAWLNEDDIEHTATADSTVPARARFDVSLPRRGERRGARFSVPGVITYHCERHAFMRGVVRVIPFTTPSRSGDLP